MLFVSLSPRSSQRPSLDQRSSTCTRLSSTCSGSNTALCIMPTQECKNGTPSSPRGTCMSLGVYFAFHKIERHTPCWPLACVLPQCHHPWVRCTDGLSAAFRASTITRRTSFLCILFSKSPIKDNNHLLSMGIICKPQAARTHRASKVTQSTIRPPADNLWRRACESVLASRGRHHQPQPHLTGENAISVYI